MTLDPEIIPVEAIQAGTVGLADRSRQYQHAQAKTPDNLLKGVNATGAIARGTRRDIDRIQKQMNLKLRNQIVIIAVTALLVRAPEICAWLLRLTQ